MRVDLDELERNHASSVDRGTGVAVVDEEDFASVIAELRAARECIDVCETTFMVFGGFTGRTFPEADEAIAKYREATKGDG